VVEPPPVCVAGVDDPPPNSVTLKLDDDDMLGGTELRPLDVLLRCVTLLFAVDSPPVSPGSVPPLVPHAAIKHIAPPTAQIRRTAAMSQSLLLSPRPAQRRAAKLPSPRRKVLWSNTSRHTALQAKRKKTIGRCHRLSSANFASRFTRELARASSHPGVAWTTPGLP